MKPKTKSARAIKEEKVAAILEKLARAKTVTFADFRGLTANQIAALRDKIRSADAELLIEKNTLVKIALRSKGLKVEGENLLTGPTAAVFAYGDEIAPVRELAESNKALGIPTFKFGFFAKDFLTAAGVDKLSKIPNRSVLQAKIVGSLNAPLYNIVSVLSANLKNLVYALNAIKDKKESLNA